MAQKTPKAKSDRTLLGSLMGISSGPADCEESVLVASSHGVVPVMDDAGRLAFIRLCRDLTFEQGVCRAVERLVPSMRPSRAGPSRFRFCERDRWCFLG
jgi:hypothetical protein